MKSPGFADAYVVALPVGGEKTINISGALVAVLSASEAFELSFGDDSFFFAAAGLSYRPIAGRNDGELVFKSLRVRNTGAAPLNVHLQVGTGEIIDNRAVFGGTSVPVTIVDTTLPRARVASDLVPGSQSIAALSSPVVSNANAARRAITIENCGTGDLYVSDFTFSTAIGLRIAPGGRVRIETATIVRVYNPNAYTVGVVIFEEIF